MLFKIIIVYASVIAVIAVAARVLALLNAAVAATKIARRLAALTLGNRTEACAAVLAEMLFIIGVFNAHTADAFAYTFATVKAEAAEFTLFNRAEGSTAVFADMIEPVGILNAEFAALAAFVVCVFKAAVGAKTAGVAKLVAVFINALSALFAKLTFVCAVASGMRVFARVGFALKAVITYGAVGVLNKFYAAVAVAADIANINAVRA